MLNNLINKACIALLSTLLVITSSCAHQEQNNMKTEAAEMIQVKVVYLDFEGGFYGLITNEGKKLLPMNLAKEYKIADTILEVQGQEVTDMATTKQWGTLFKLSNIKLIKLGSKLLPNEH